MTVEDLKPCPLCGTPSPWTMISAFHAVLACACGLTMRDNCVTVIVKRDEVPKGLESHVYEATGLVMEARDGTQTAHPDHGYVGINVPAAFAHAGITAKWNRREVSP